MCRVCATRSVRIGDEARLHGERQRGPEVPDAGGSAELLARSAPGARMVQVDVFTCPAARRTADLIFEVLSELVAGRKPERRDRQVREIRPSKCHQQDNYDRPGNPHRGPRQDQHSPRRTGPASHEAYFHVTQFRGFEKFVRRPAVLRNAVADGAHLRHLPGQPPDRIGQGVRRAYGGADSADRRRSCGDHEPGADRAVARAQLLLPLFTGPAARHGRRSGRAQRLRRAAAAPGTGARRHRLRNSASRSSNGWAASAFIPAWVVPGGVNEPLDTERRDGRSWPRCRRRRRSRSARSTGSRPCWSTSARRSAPSATSPRMFMGLVDARTASLAHYDGKHPRSWMPPDTSWRTSVDPSMYRRVSSAK